jgi:hypothetical protein
MSDRDDMAAKLEAFLEVLEDLIGETLAAGVSEVGLRRTLLARAVFEFKAYPSDGIAALDHFRKALERGLAQSSAPVAG